MPKRAIPPVPKADNMQAKLFFDALKEHIESISGGRGGKLSYLQDTATNADIIAKINELIRRIQD